MTENRRRGGLSEEEINLLAETLAVKLDNKNECKLTEAQQQAVIDFLTVKKKAVKATLWIMGAIVLWVLKDVYFYVTQHVFWGK